MVEGMSFSWRREKRNLSVYPKHVVRQKGLASYAFHEKPLGDKSFKKSFVSARWYIRTNAKLPKFAGEISNPLLIPYFALSFAARKFNESVKSF